MPIITMRKNKNTKILGRNVVLVPYKRKHVPKYHEWMKSSELQYLTASEPLTLNEEYKMQQSWLEDEDKCTFIILDRSVLEETGDEIDAMIGDTNLFFTKSENDMIVAEAEIMIAEKNVRRKRRGLEAMVLMLRYGCDMLSVKKYQAKIRMDNTISIMMFQKLGFEQVSASEVFKEITMEKCVDANWRKWLESETNDSLRLETEE